MLLWVCVYSHKGLRMCEKEFTLAHSKIEKNKNAHKNSESGYIVPQITHWVIIPNYKERVEIIRQTLEAIAMQSIGPERICIILAYEAAEDGARAKLLDLPMRFKEFRKFVLHEHRLLAGEVAGKSANESSAFRSLCAVAYDATKDKSLENLASSVDRSAWSDYTAHTLEEGDLFSNFANQSVVTIMDADSILHQYHLYGIEKSYNFTNHDERYRCIWQAPISNMMNMYSVPAPSRLMCMIVSLHEMASLAHPTQQKLPFSTYSLSAKLAIDMGGWASDVLAEDWHCMARAFFATLGSVRIVPLFFPVLCYAVKESTYWTSCTARFEQAKRHAWAVIEIACVYAFWRSIPSEHRPLLGDYLAMLWKMFKLHYIAIFQTPMVVGSLIFNTQLANVGFSFFTPQPDNPLWLVFAVSTVLMSILPLLTIVSFRTALLYESVLRNQRLCANDHADMSGIASRIQICDDGEKNDYDLAFLFTRILQRMTMPKSSNWQRLRLLTEFIFVMPVTSLVYGFLPSIISHTILLFRTHYSYVVAPKPSLETKL